MRGHWVPLILIFMVLVMPACKSQRMTFAPDSAPAMAATGSIAVIPGISNQPSTNLIPAVAVVGQAGPVGPFTVLHDGMPQSNPLSLGGQRFVVDTTAYCHSEPDSLPYGMKCADGSDLKFGMVRSAAADWSRYPVGTKFRIKGLPYEYVVDDYGSALVGTDTIDLYKPTYTAMNQWGRREVSIKVIEWGSFERSRKILSERIHKPDAHHVREMLGAITEKRTSNKVKIMPIQPSLIPVSLPVKADPRDSAGA